MKLSFDIQRFGGGKGSSTTVENTYTPTEYEIQLQKAQADYADAVAPNALYLNDVARSLLQDSIGTVQVDYNTLNENAQRQIANAMGNLSGLTASNTGAVDAANDTLANISNQYGQAATNNFGRLEGLANQYRGEADRTNSALAQYIRQNNDVTNGVNGDLLGYIRGNTDVTNDTNSDLAQYVRRNSLADSLVDDSLAGLQEGYLPARYQQNMEDSIRSALNRTIGQNVNSLGQRGVINSSVTTSALNDIERNAADAVAQQYLNNLNTVGNFAQQRYGNAMNTNNANASLAQQQLSNAMNANSTNAALAQQRYSNAMNTSGTNASLTQQQLSNTNNALGNVGNIYNTQYGQLTDALGNQASLAQQQVQNTLGANQANAGIYESLIGNATAPIATAAAAQEAAQAPATNLWNASLGLNSATTGALSAAAGKGTSTQTTTQSGGGSFLGGLLGAGIQAAAGSYGTLWCFPAGTMVHMADGTQKDIKDVEAGDLVLSKDGKAQSVVTKMNEHENDVYEVVTYDGKRTRATLSQPFLMADGSWEELLGIEVRAELKNVGRVKSVTRVGKMMVYDFETAGDNTYVVDDGFVAQGGSTDIWGRQ